MIPKIFIFLFISIYSQSDNSSEKEFFNIFENYYFPDQIYLDIEEEKELASRTLQKLMEFPFEISDIKILKNKKKEKINVPKESYFYLRICYLENLIIEDGLIIGRSEKKNKYKIIPDKSWNYFKKTSGLPHPYYLNCCFNVSKDMKEKTFSGKNFVKAKKKKSFCNKDFCYDVIFTFYLINSNESNNFLKNFNGKIIFKVINIIEKAPFSNKRILEIYGELLYTLQ